MQVPTEPALLHAWQVPAHVVLQHTPSTQLPLVHSALMEQALPLPSSAHAPAPLHVVAPVHSFAGSVFAGTFEHVPTLPATLHAWHVPLQVELQQYPSTQFALRHSVAVAHTSPVTFLHTDAEQTCVPAHSLSGSVPFVMAAHVPFVPPVFAAEQAWQAPVHVELQQKPSTHAPLEHSAFAEHAAP